jgi:GntR family transcriptional regulator
MSAPAALRVDTRDPTPPYEQLRRQFATLIESGVLRPGQRLPPLRQLAADLGLAVGTVARTYRELEAVGLVTSRRGGGTRVRSDSPSPGSAEREALLRGHADAFVRSSRLLGATDREIGRALRAALGASGASSPR